MAKGVNIRPRQRGFTPYLQLKDDIPPEKWPLPIRRASGECLCDVCDEPLYDHYQPAKASCGTLVIDCTETWWKL